MNAAASRLAIVTGASRGIGRAIAERLARDGVTVVVNYRGDAGRAESVVARIEAAGGTAHAVRADVSRIEDIRRLFGAVEDLGYRPDIVVANAGAYWLKPVVEVSEEEFDSMFALNARGTFFVLQEAARRVADGGRIMFISSTITGKRFPRGAAYAGSKAAGEQFVKALADELGPRGITANSISPGPTDTRILPDDPDIRESLKHLSPLGRLGRPADIAAVVAFLASEEGGWITGQNIRASGGNI
jgi:3-oxoacyl-[acyl-carrier protein] reductase